MSRYIDSDELIKKLKAFADLYKTSTHKPDKARRDELQSVIAEVINMPAVDIEPVRLGTWLATDKSKLLKCSRCGETIFFESTAGIRQHYRYCHRCGAKMDKE